MKHNNNELLALSAVVLLGFYLAFIYLYINQYYLHLSYPYNTFLFNPDIKFSDFFSEVNLAKDLKPYDDVVNSRAVYFPFAYIIFYIFGLTGSMAYIYNFVIFIIFIFFIAYKLIKPINISEKISISIIVLMSYPVLFAIDRGNIETMVFVFTGLFLYFFAKNEKKAIIFLAMAGSMKLYPLIFASLYLLDSKIKYLIYVIMLTFVVTILSLFVFSNEVLHSVNGILSGQEFFKINYVFGGAAVAYESSLFAFFRLLSQITPYEFNPAKMYLPYLISVLFLYSILLYAMYILNMKLWEKITIISFGLILFPFVSFDYKLIYVFFPILFFIGAENGEKIKTDIYLVVVFSLLLISKNYYFIYSNVSISVLINPLLMLMSILYIVLKNIYYFRIQRYTGKIHTNKQSPS